MSFPEPSAFDEATAHVHFSKACFNRTWTLIEQADRTPADDEAMVETCMASLWHWRQRPDCTDRERSIGHWQASRVHALLGDGPAAMRQARLSLDHGTRLAPFHVAYAHEARARAALLQGDVAAAAAHAMQARVLAQAVADADDRELLLKDLATLGRDGAVASHP